MTSTLSASVIGASGYAGGELLRLLADHPAFRIAQATSREYAGRSVGYVHPNLRDLSVRFSEPASLESVDVLFAATPHGVSMERIDAYREAAGTVVDLSADFRLEAASDYDTYYDGHSRPDLLGEAVYGLPELNRDQLPGATFIAVGGCNATATALGLAPLVSNGPIDATTRVVADIKVGSSEGGAGGGRASAHAERSGVVRPYAPTGHRHEAEVRQELGVDVSFTVHAVDMVRGAAATCHLFPEADLEKRALWRAYRSAYEDEPFVRFVAGGGVYRYPEPKAVAGTNGVEIGFEVDAAHDRLVVFTAIDNVMKGAAGQAVHAANLAHGIDETTGLEHRGLHPVGAP